MALEIVTTCDDCGAEERVAQDSYNDRIRPPDGWQWGIVGARMLMRCQACADAIRTATFRAEAEATAEALEERRRIVAEARANGGA